MRYFLAAPLAVGIMCLSACSSSNEREASNDNAVIKNDFESLEGWVGGETTKSLTREQAHSGKYSVKVGPGAEYGLGYSNTLGKLSPVKFAKFKVSAWAFMPDEQAAPAIVVELKNPVSGKGLLWDKVALNQDGAYGKWTRVEKEVTLPAEADYSTQLTLYGWSAGSAQASYIDDVEVSLVK